MRISGPTDRSGLTDYLAVLDEHDYQDDFKTCRCGVECTRGLRVHRNDVIRGWITDARNETIDTLTSAAAVMIDEAAQRSGKARTVGETSSYAARARDWEEVRDWISGHRPDAAENTDRHRVGRSRGRT